jgi:two-component system, cell cycle sensor histidine kinase and response regulator CckA
MQAKPEMPRGRTRVYGMISLYISLFIITGGCAVLAGWALDIPFLRSILPNYVTMKANTAVCFILIGLSLLSRHKPLMFKWSGIGFTYLSGFTLFSIGTLTALEYLSGANFGIDQFLFQERAASVLTSSPGRMALNTAANFILFGIAILLVRINDKLAVYATQLLALMAGGIAFLALTGYIYGAAPLIIGQRYSTAMAIHTAILFITSCIGFLFVRPELGIMKTITQDNPSGNVIRSLLPIAVIMPLVLGGLKIYTQRNGIISNETGVALVAVMNAVVTSIYIYLVTLIAGRSENMRRLKEEELKLKNVILSTQQEASIDGILVVDEKGSIISYNRQFINLWGVPPAALRSKSDEAVLQSVINKLVNPDEFMKKVKYLYENKAEISRDEVNLKNNVIFDRYSAPMIDSEGKYYGRVWYFRDISEQKHLQEKYSHSQKMAAVGQLAGGVAHEINNPLTVILGFAQVELGSAAKNSALRDSLEAIERESLRCKKLVSDLLMFSRDWKEEKIIGDVNEVVENAFRLVESQLKAKRITVSKNYERSLPEIMMNADRMQQVIINLLSNAKDAVSEGGQISATTKQNIDMIRIEIKDDGEGISENARKHLFEPFFSTKKQGEGTGLGLSICHEIVSKHNGTIDVTSVKGKGTTFTIKLPLTGATHNEYLR